MKEKKRKPGIREGHTQTSNKFPESISQQNAQIQNQIMTPNDPSQYIDARQHPATAKPDTDDGPYWNSPLPTPALGSTRIME